MGATAHVGTAALRGNIPILTWKDLRDDRVVKQNLDYSCGAASVATILSEYYGIPEATEKRVLEIINKEIAASFHDLSQAVKDYGMKGLGLALDFAQLKRLKIPAVAYLRYRGDDHFSVIRGVSRDGYVHLGDPSWGNRIFSKRQFLAMWETREGKTLKGKILLLLPTEQTTVATDPVFFIPPIHNGLPETLLGVHTF